LITTPNFPTYTSGHSTFSGAAAAVLADFFGRDNIAFTLPSENESAADRSFDSFSQAAQESADSRLYGGIHFRFDNQDGLTSGTALGHYVWDNFLVPDSNQHSRWIGDVFVDVLGRRGDGPGIRHWLSKAQAGWTRAQVVDGFLESREYLHGLVKGVYQSVLGRVAETAALSFWGEQLARGMAEAELIGRVAASQEFADRALARGDDFVPALYGSLLGRAGGEAEWLYWNKRLAVGDTRFVVASQFVDSDEFLALLVDDRADLHSFAGWYQRYLGRNAEPAGRDYWAGAARTAPHWRDAVESFLASPEWANA
jgi:hypothetical protein